MRVCEQFLFNLNVGVDSEDIRKVLRMGRRSDDAASPRPVLVQLGSRHINQSINQSINTFITCHGILKIWLWNHCIKLNQWTLDSRT